MDDNQEKNDKDKQDIDHYQPQFIVTKDNLDKVKKAFDQSREKSMKGKFEGWSEI